LLILIERSNTYGWIWLNSHTHIFLMNFLLWLFFSRSFDCRVFTKHISHRSRVSTGRTSLLPYRLFFSSSYASTYILVVIILLHHLLLVTVSHRCEKIIKCCYNIGQYVYIRHTHPREDCEYEKKEKEKKKPRNKYLVVLISSFSERWLQIQSFFSSFFLLSFNSSLVFFFRVLSCICIKRTEHSS